MLERPAKAASPKRATPAKLDGRRLRGDRARAMVLARAMEIASTKGISAITLGELADDLNLGKSNITVLFGDKLSLQKAILDAAAARFVEHIVTPVQQLESPLQRLRELCDRWFRHLENKVFPGGCVLFATINELRAQPGVLRDHAMQLYENWHRRLGAEIRRAIEAGEVAPDTDVENVVLTIKAFQNSAHVAMLLRDRDSFDRAWQMVRQQIDAIARSTR